MKDTPHLPMFRSAVTHSLFFTLIRQEPVSFVKNNEPDASNTHAADQWVLIVLKMLTG